MILVFTSKGKSWDSELDERFGRADFLLFYNQNSNHLDIVNNRDNQNHAHGIGPKTVQKLVEYGADILITGNGPGGNASNLLKKSGLKTFIGAGKMSVKKAYDLFKENKLTLFE